MKKVAFISLGACDGCQVVFVSLSDYLNKLENEGIAQLVACPLIGDRWERERVDIAFVEGAIVTKEHEETIKRLREKSKILVAIGTCACFGGITSLVKFKDVEVPFKRELKYTPPLTLPKPVIDVVEVDYAISRCPPLPHHIKEVLDALLEERKPKRFTSISVCSQCKRIMKPIEKLEFRVEYNPKDLDPNVCLLSQGIICLGAVTIGGCGARCPSIGIACSGCGGPSIEIGMIKGLEPLHKLAMIVSALSGMSYEESLKALEDVIEPHKLYVFTSGSRILLSKPRSKLLKYVKR